MAERTILQRAASGDEAAFAGIVREHQSMVFSIGYHVLRDRWVADELAQEVFLHLYQNLRSIESEAHLVHWLRRVAMHRAIDASRRRRPQVALEHLPELAGKDESVDLLLRDRLLLLLSRLPEQARAIVTLRYQEDMEPQEIAKLLDVPLGTVKSRLHRALNLLREKLERKTR